MPTNGNVKGDWPRRITVQCQRQGCGNQSKLNLDDVVLPNDVCSPKLTSIKDFGVIVREPAVADCREPIRSVGPRLAAVGCRGESFFSQSLELQSV